MLDCSTISVSFTRLRAPLGLVWFGQLTFQLLGKSNWAVPSCTGSVFASEKGECSKLGAQMLVLGRDTPSRSLPL